VPVFSVPLGYVGVLLLADSEVDHCVPFLQGGGGVVVCLRFCCSVLLGMGVPGSLRQCALFSAESYYDVFL